MTEVELNIFLELRKNLIVTLFWNSYSFFIVICQNAEINDLNSILQFF